jgi:hypothetical protein
MTLPETLSPILAVGARVEVNYQTGVLTCRLQAVHRSTLHLALSPDTRRTEMLREGVPVKLAMYLPLTVSGGSGACIETETTIREWVWKRPPLLVVGPVHEWREYMGHTQDISASGVSLMVAGLEDVGEGTVGRMTLQVDDGLWCDDLPVRVARVRHWLRSAGRSVEIGAQLQLSSEVQSLRWQECLRWLGVEE